MNLDEPKSHVTNQRKFQMKKRDEVGTGPDRNGQIFETVDVQQQVERITTSNEQWSAA